MDVDGEKLEQVVPTTLEDALGRVFPGACWICFTKRATFPIPQRKRNQSCCPRRELGCRKSCSRNCLPRKSSDPTSRVGRGCSLVRTLPLRSYQAIPGVDGPCEINCKSVGCVGSRWRNKTAS